MNWYHYLLAPPLVALGVLLYSSCRLAGVSVCLWFQRRNQRSVDDVLRHRVPYPFGLEVVETHTAGEFVCDNCGTNNYFSLIHLSPQQVPPEVRQDAANRGVTEFLRAPLIIRCHRCGTLYANGDAAGHMQQADDA